MNAALLLISGWATGFLPAPTAPTADVAPPSEMAPAVEVAPAASPTPTPAVPPAIAQPPVDNAPPPAVAASASVRVGDTTVFEVRGARGTKSPEQRAREATTALGRIIDGNRVAPVRVATQNDVATVLAGDAPIIELTAQDAELAGDSSLDVHAAKVAARLREVIEGEQRRAAIAQAVFSLSLVVFFAVIAFYLIRRLGEFAEKGRLWLDERADRELSLQFRKIEVMSAATVRSTGVMAVGLAKWIALLGVAYAWLVVALSMFEATRDYTQRLTGFVLGPLSTLMERIASALPLVVVASIAALAVFVLIRYIDLFFRSVARGETPLPWLPAELAAPMSVLVRAGVVVASLVFAAPVVVGEGALSRAGMVILVTLALASTPVLASAVVGAAVLFGRRLRVGDFAEIAGRRGRISAVNLLEVRLRDEERVEVRVPHLFSLLHPLRLLGPRPRISVELRASSSAPPADLIARLNAAAARHGRDVAVDLVTIDATSALYRVSVSCDSLEMRTALAVSVLEAMSQAGAASESKSA